MTLKFKIFVGLVVFFAVSALFLSSNVQAMPDIDKIDQQRNDSIDTEETTPAEQAAILSYWTREAIAAAQPLPFPQVVEDSSNDDFIDPTNVNMAPSAVSGHAPDPIAESIAQVEFPEDWQIDFDSSADDANFSPEGTAGVFTSYRANYYSQMHTSYPFKTVGRLTFTTLTGNASCTATVISPNNVIVTAAHCVYDTVGNRYYTNFAFTPAWRNGSAPYGTFPFTQRYVLDNWRNASNTVIRYDVAIIKLGNNSSGRSVTYYTGYAGRSWNYNNLQSIHAFGYPSNLSSGNYTYVCAAETFSGGTDVLGMGCNMTNGSSGGPWFRIYAPYGSGSTNYVNAVVSSGTSGTNTFYGPKFTSNNIVPLCTQGPFTC